MGRKDNVQIGEIQVRGWVFGGCMCASPFQTCNTSNSHVWWCRNFSPSPFWIHEDTSLHVQGNKLVSCGEALCILQWWWWGTMQFNCASSTHRQPWLLLHSSSLNHWCQHYRWSIIRLSLIKREEASNLQKTSQAVVLSYYPPCEPPWLAASASRVGRPLLRPPLYQPCYHLQWV